ncbi:MAG: sugar phosphate isomerase/epimerase [Verrucomicrobiaceae bacterium]|nr:sugar phosphate isomerase/epimerase [Verrucomicrobiaceae bacterium]
MRLALNSSTIKPTPLLDKIRIAGAAGYAGIELWAVELYEHVGRGGEISEVEKALADHGLEVPCFIAVRNWGESEGWEYRLAMDEARRRFELAARLGAPLMVCTPPLQRPGIAGLARGYADLLQIGRDTGVRAVLEYISFFASLTNIPDTVAVLDECGDPDGCTILDAFHNWNNRTTLADVRALPLERIAHYHINDAAPGIPSGSQKDPDRVMPGDGVIDLREELGALREKGYEGWLSLELFNAEWWAKDPLETAKTGLERMKALCAEVGWQEREG